ncbi:hypothetical protein TorRG33x02_240770 [Trema orientale]|uniref:Uncharacterized protein n=1 Tax=Trema orientale TaxID=63057 RepID=A0A2P5DUZ1_TREOI|nr:hypothetical protein TorRG33x02_240770 [Trema orientale]
MLRGCLSIGLHVTIRNSTQEDMFPRHWTKKWNNPIGFQGLLKKDSFSRVLFELRSVEILLEQHCRALLLYDPLTESFNDVQFKGIPNWFETIFHVGIFTQIGTLFGI